MHVILTVCAGLILGLCALIHHSVVKWADKALESQRLCERTAMALRAERDRVTVLERETDALRRELRKLAGKFYAAQREVEEPADSNPPAITDPLALHPYCENYGRAQAQGPLSEAARCACGYCEAKRQQKKAFRDQAVPRTVQGQAELARLNAGKP